MEKGNSSSTRLGKAKDDEQDENKFRGNWSHPLDFVLSCLGSAVGLGNVWRFPFLCYRNGGGAFLIPYFMGLFLAGIPLFFMEVTFGQYCSLGIFTCWRALPILKGISYGQVITSLYLTTTYGVIITYAFYYFFVSFTSELPWKGCDKSWNSAMCSNLVNDCLQANGVITFDNDCVPLANLTEYELESFNITVDGVGNYSLLNYTDPFKALRKSPSEEYWIHGVLQETASMNEVGTIVWPLFLCLAASYIVVFLCLFKGIKSTGKVVYFTATFPYVVLVVLLVRGVTLPGASKGIYFFITPRWEYLVKPKVWLDALVQIIYSLSLANGSNQTLASYNKFHSNVYRDTLIVVLMNTATSILAGFAIFTILGYMAHLQGKDVSEVVRQGFGLAFVAYPEAVAKMPVAPLWSSLFFFMLITLGLDSLFVSFEKLATGLVDEWPQIFPPHRKTLVTFGVCLIFFLLSLICVTRSGPYWISLFDNYGANFTKILFVLLFTGGISWLYGIRRFVNDLRSMIGDKYVDHWHFKWWQFNWVILTPLIAATILVFNWVSWTEPEYNGEYPQWAKVLGWMIMMTTLIGIPGHAIVLLIRTRGSFRQRLLIAISPEDSWGPALPNFRREAARVHALHGTTMGGIVDLGNGSRFYDTLNKDEMEDAI